MNHPTFTPQQATQLIDHSNRLADIPRITGVSNGPRSTVFDRDAGDTAGRTIETARELGVDGAGEKVARLYEALCDYDDNDVEEAVRILTDMGFTVEVELPALTITATPDTVDEADDGNTPIWTAWTEEQQDHMLADIGQKAADLVARIAWHQWNKLDGPENPSDSRTACLQALEDLRGLMNRDARG